MSRDEFDQGLPLLGSKPKYSTQYHPKSIDPSPFEACQLAFRASEPASMLR
jgi:hypothetical protein